MYEESFDLTFSPKEAGKLMRALGNEEGSTKRFASVFRALTRYIIPHYGSILLSDKFPELLRQHGIRTTDQLGQGSPFNHERQDARQELSRQIS